MGRKHRGTLARAALASLRENQKHWYYDFRRLTPRTLDPCGQITSQSLRRVPWLWGSLGVALG